MGMGNRLGFTAVGALVILSGCSHQELGGEFKNSVLSNQNPAPMVLSPPESANETMDPTHMRTQADYHFAMGEALSLDGESVKALEAFKLATVYDPQSAELRLRVAAEYLKQGLMSEAVENAEEATRIDGKHLDSKIFLGGVYSSLRLYPQAEEQYQQVLIQDPKNSDVLIYLGALQSEQDNFDGAEDYFLRASRVPENEKAHLAHFYLAKMQLTRKEKRLEKAAEALRKALSVKPEFEEGALALAEVYEAQGEKDKGIKFLESFQRQYGPKKATAEQLAQAFLEKADYDKAFEHLRTLEGFDPANLNVKVKMALILIEQKKYEAAVDRLEQILSLAPSSDKIRYYLAAVYEELEKNELAVTNYKKVDETSTYFAESSVRAANLMRKKGNIKGALELMQIAVQRRDDAPQMVAYYASLLDETKDYKTGVSVLEGATKRFPENTQLLFYLGNLYDRVQKPQKTIETMKRVIDLDPKHVQALNYLAFTYAETSQNLSEAEDLAHRALDLQPNDGYILDTVGWVYFKQGKTAEAIRFLEAAQRQKPKEAIVAEHLGDAYYVFELVDKARAMYERAAGLEDDPSKVEKIRSKIANIVSPVSRDRLPASVRDDRPTESAP
jgi:tetratricopeptide (TPR) repeat protein